MKTLFYFSSLILAVYSQNNPIVTVKEGKLKGATAKLYDGSTYYSFKGVPYAEPPVGKLRFKAPLPVKPWNGVREAIEHGPVCTQVDTTTNEIIEGSEDCLFVNIYTKTLNHNAKKPVMVFIHGGSFMSGSGNNDLYGPEYLVEHDVILVTLNYRLEALGFLCLETPEVPGNAGMKDQVVALQWVKDNIAQFGGDSNNVVLFGESAGGAAVTYHMISPMSQGLFHKVIAQSGVFLHNWAEGKHGKERAFRAGKYLGKETNNTEELLEFLQSVPAVKLTNLTFTTSTAEERHRGLPMYYVPVVEKKFHNVVSFINEDPLSMILANKIAKVPLIVGYNSNEGILMVDYRLQQIDFTNKNPSYSVPREVAEKVSQDKMTDMGKRIRKFYIGDREFTNNDTQQISEMETDINFLYNIHCFTHFYSKYSKPIYMYRFDFDTDLNFVKNATGFTNLTGAAHADDLFYLFNNDFTRDKYEAQDNLKDIVRRVTKLWTDFAKTGNPTPEDCSDVKWPPYSVNNKEYFNINTRFSVGQYAEKKRMEFWDQLYIEAGLPGMANTH